MDTAQQTITVNGSGNAIRVVGSRITVDGRVRVFVASFDDIENLVYLLARVHHESPQLSLYPFDEEQARNSVANMMARDDALAMVSYLNGKAIGCMGAMLCPQLTSKAKIASELLLYVVPESRGSRAALLMVRLFEEWAKPYDMRAGSSLGIDDKKAIDFYNRLGYFTESIGVMKRGSENV